MAGNGEIGLVKKGKHYWSVSSIYKPEHNGFIFAYVGPKGVDCSHNKAFI